MAKSHIHDPALIAAEMVQRAEVAFTSMPVENALDELREEFVLAEAHWEAADEAFADSVPTSPQGGLAKLRALLELLQAIPLDEDSLELRHVRSLMAYMEPMGSQRQSS